jgi:hypothetical protein
LVSAFLLTQKLAERDQDLGGIVDLLRRAHERDAEGVNEKFCAVTGQEVPDWMKQR